MENDVSFCIFHYLYHSIRAKKRHSRLKCPQKLDKNSTQKLFKQPKGLAVCELQAAGPLALP